MIKENGAPRFVVLDWKTYRAWEEMREDFEDTQRLTAALADPKNQRRIPYARVKKLLNFHDRSFLPAKSARGNPKRVSR